MSLKKYIIQTKAWHKGADCGQTGNSPLLDQNVAEILSYSTMRDEPLTQEDYRARFYSDYRKVAEEYDKEFLKKYDEDLNTTLIFVSPALSFDEGVLTRPSGWSVLGCHLRFYHPGRFPTPARPQQ